MLFASGQKVGDRLAEEIVEVAGVEVVLEVKSSVFAAVGSSVVAAAVVAAVFVLLDDMVGDGDVSFVTSSVVDVTVVSAARVEAVDVRAPDVKRDVVGGNVVLSPSESLGESPSSGQITPGLHGSMEQQPLNPLPQL